jgi:hypothetical protein
VQVASGKIGFKGLVDQGPLTFSGNRKGDVIAGTVVRQARQVHPLRLLDNPIAP